MLTGELQDGFMALVLTPSLLGCFNGKKFWEIIFLCWLYSIHNYTLPSICFHLQFENGNTICLPRKNFIRKLGFDEKFYC